MSTIQANAILDASGGNTTTINGVTPTAYNTIGKNLIINGAMEIDQRLSGTVSASGFLVDRFYLGQSQSSKGSATVQTADVPVGFASALKYTSSSSYSVVSTDYFFINQKIEGLNLKHLNWGSANAKTITVSFWVKSSLTGTFGGAIRNSSFNYNYPFEYTISSANTWEQKSVTISGPTSGTWLTTNGTGLDLWFSLGMGSAYSDTAGSWTATLGLGSSTGATSVVGTNAATFLITGVQLEVGSVATEFERRPYGMELALCQRYYEKSYSIDVVPGTATANGLVYMSTGTSTAGDKAATAFFKVEKRSNPSISYWDSPGNASRIDSGGTNRVGAINFQNTVSVNIRQNAGGGYGSADIGWHFVASAEL